jgi:hypothetical protein
MMERGLSLLDSGSIETATLDRILQAVVFFADSIAIRASYEVTHADRSRESDLEWRIDALREQGFIKLWAHEYEVDDAGYAANPSTGIAVRRRADLVVEQTSLSRSLGEMDELMRSIREEAYGRSRSGNPVLRQGTAEIVGLRHNLGSLVVSSELNQDGLLTNPATRAALQNGFTALGGSESFQMAVVKEVVSKLQLGSLSQLTNEQIEECRRYSADFRQLLDQSLLAVAHGMSPTLTPEAIATELVSRYRAITAEYGEPRVFREAGQEVFWDVLGATLPPTIVLKYGLKGLRWRKEALAARPYLLIMHLERSFTTQAREADRWRKDTGLF